MFNYTTDNSYLVKGCHKKNIYSPKRYIKRAPI